jgi:hypothetical protein
VYLFFLNGKITDEKGGGAAEEKAWTNRTKETAKPNLALSCLSSSYINAQTLYYINVGTFQGREPRVEGERGQAQPEHGAPLRHPHVRHLLHRLLPQDLPQQQVPRQKCELHQTEYLNKGPIPVFLVFLDFS